MSSQIPVQQVEASTIRGLYKWYGLDRKDELPRIVAGKYLKLLYEIHERNGTLGKGDLKKDGKLDVLDLDSY
jgi:hypothetical protein